ncbi:MAG: hypothetical protein PHF56_08865 [Desulfuromonadaceae bacterium]|nr:hypothetical protein [Desulfuromonadaceae bacterium]
MIRKITALAFLVIFLCAASEEIYAGQPGTADMVFNRRFMEKLTPMMPFDLLVKMVGTEGTKSGEDKRSSPPTVIYHWNGERKSTLDVKVSAGKVVNATAISPKNKKFSIGKTGE